MTVFRISRRRYIEDLSGEGARLFGGRWNPKGTAVVYTAENRALATVEFLVHMPMALVPADICLATIITPDDAPCDELDVNTLPHDWRTTPSMNELAQRGKDWVERAESLLLRVPSAVVPGEWNILVNPHHQSAPLISLGAVEPFTFDDRLLKRA